MPMTAPAPPPTDSPLRAAVRFWEPGRLGYNAVLALVTVWGFGFSEPEALVQAWPLLAVLAVGANLAYTVAYPAEFLAGALGAGALWRRIRVGVWIVGTALAAGLAGLVMFGLGAAGGLPITPD